MEQRSNPLAKAIYIVLGLIAVVIGLEMLLAILKITITLGSFILGVAILVGIAYLVWRFLIAISKSL